MLDSSSIIPTNIYFVGIYILLTIRAEHYSTENVQKMSNLLYRRCFNPKAQHDRAIKRRQPHRAKWTAAKRIWWTSTWQFPLTSIALSLNSDCDRIQAHEKSNERSAVGRILPVRCDSSNHICLTQWKKLDRPFDIFPNKARRQEKRKGTFHLQINLDTLDMNCVNSHFINIQYDSHNSNKQITKIR